MKTYIDVPQFTTLHDIEEREYTLSATQYKTFCINNTNVLKIGDFLDRPLNRTDLGNEVGSENYVEHSNVLFIKTKALQEETYLLNEVSDAFEYIVPSTFINMNLKENDIIISKDSNVGEIAILDKDYPNAMLCGGIYRLPVSNNRLYLLAFIKHQIVRQQIDFLVPRGSTIRHGKTKFLECFIPVPNVNKEETIKYVECLMQAIINKEIAIRKKHSKIITLIDEELEANQQENLYSYTHPSINEIMELDRMDSSLYSKDFKEKQHLVRNYINGFSTIEELGFNISRGQNLQISNIGSSVQTKEKKENYYTLILPNYITKYGTTSQCTYLGNKNILKTLNVGDIIFGAEGNEKGRSLVVFENNEKTITNIHGITLNQNSQDLTKSVFVKLFLDWYRSKGMIDAYAVGGNGGSLAIKYWDCLKFPNFAGDVELSITNEYHNDTTYTPQSYTTSTFLAYDDEFNRCAGIYEIDKSLKYLKEKLNIAIQNIADDVEVDISF